MDTSNTFHRIQIGQVARYYHGLSFQTEEKDSIFFCDSHSLICCIAIRPSEGHLTVVNTTVNAVSKFRNMCTRC